MFFAWIVSFVSTYARITNKTLRTQKVIHISTVVNSERVIETTTWAMECGPVLSLFSYSLLLPAHEESSPHTSKLNEMLFLWSQIFLWWFYITLFYCLPAFIVIGLFSFLWGGHIRLLLQLRVNKQNAIQTLVFLDDFSLVFVLSFWHQVYTAFCELRCIWITRW